MRQRVGERAETSSITQTAKYGRGLFANCKVGDLYQMKGKLNQPGYHSILQHHVILSEKRLVGQGFLLMGNNHPKHISKLCQRYIKSKEEQYVLKLMS